MKYLLRSLACVITTFYKRGKQDSFANPASVVIKSAAQRLTRFQGSESLLYLSSRTPFPT